MSSPCGVPCLPSIRICLEVLDQSRVKPGGFLFPSGGCLVDFGFSFTDTKVSVGFSKSGCFPVQAWKLISRGMPASP